MNLNFKYFFQKKKLKCENEIKKGIKNEIRSSMFDKKPSVLIDHDTSRSQKPLEDWGRYQLA